MYNDNTYSHRVSGRSGTPIFYENNKSRDDHAEGMRLWPSEIGWQSLLMAAMKDNLPSTKLHAIVQHSVVEKQTRMVRHEAARISSCTRSGPNRY